MPLALLQAAADTAAAFADTVAAPRAAPAADPSFWDSLRGGYDVIALGGPVMIPIVLFSILTLAILWERFRVLRRARTDTDRLTRTVADFVHRGDRNGAMAFCQTENSPASRILLRGLERLGRPIDEIKENLQEAGRRETYRLEARMDLLASVASLAPMLGFLGTVTGMIEAFQQIQTYEGAVNPALLAGGISEALISTAAGLIVGVPALFFYNLLIARIGHIVNGLEHVSADFVDVLQTPTPRPAAPAFEPTPSTV